MDRPEAAHLDPRTSSVGLAAVGTDPLDAFITYPGIAPGDGALINWRGHCDDGSAEDLFGVHSADALDGRERWRFHIPNAAVTVLRTNLVFYSFQPLNGAGNPVGDESLRRYFFIDRPMLPAWVPEIARTCLRRFCKI
ncbi:hypothetical protein N5F23_23925 [Pseudomonas sichuanensis]|uniref:hypothetical protein n=1 Tax=Pseudomonas sichuanensis TaxID=2213015 RepID=UPI00244D4F78|nr:hypothetical protein [Pseudomonas sichuanensis]MDH0732386.1 hypothetical protein [Pseudomonas sichuanensis]MDH1585645.1 hypothetical protein [Pseudomonas sichuanensis]MDH1595130.1 hypothetical protein [Pseudomonas sichuanensis]MDH1599757.1 hypothetical protein [Pseudomonas sichuanensis]